VIGVGYRPRTGSVFFTRNGKKLDDVAHGLKTQNFFPTVGANGPCTVHVNFGQSGFVFIEANVKKWGLAPMTGSLAPPPPYGSEQGSILLEAGRDGSHTNQGGYLVSDQSRLRGGNFGIAPPASPGPLQSPTDISLAQLSHFSSTPDVGLGNSREVESNIEILRDITQLQRAGEEERDTCTAPPPEYTSSKVFGSLNQMSTGNSLDRTDTPVPSYDVAVRNQ
jgi:hypothetical protein